MFGLGAGELFLIFLIALFFLGPKKLPELAKGLGSAVREFNKAKDQMMQEINRHENEIKTELKTETKLVEETHATDEEVMTKKSDSPMALASNHHDDEEIVTKKPSA